MTPALLALALLAGGLVLLAVTLRPTAAVLLFVVVLVSSASDVVGYVGPLSLFLVTFAVAVAALGFAVWRGELRLVWSPVFLFAGLFLAARALSLVVARDPERGIAVVFAEARDLLVLVVLVTFLAAAPRLRLVVAAATGVVAALAGLSLLQEFVFYNATDFAGFSYTPIEADLGGTRVRHSGPEQDVNQWARNLLLFLPLALALAAHRCAGHRRWLWLVAAAAMLGGLYLTQSRGGLLGLVTGLVVWLALSGRAVVKLAALFAVVAVVAVLVPGAGSRVATLTLLGTDTPGVTDPSLSNRAAVQRVGTAMALDHPLLGVGAGNFEVREREYQRETAQVITEGVIAPHNLYLQMQAESGVIGLAAWLAFFSAAAAAAARAWRSARRLAPGRTSLGGLLSAGVLAALAGWAVASVPLHLSDFSVLLVVVALAVALDLRARQALTAGSPLPPTPRQPQQSPAPAEASRA